ncbi:MAG: TRL-like family protein [Candidatus Sumerlaeota bacterium]
MNKFKLPALVLTLLVGLILFNGCVFAPVVPPRGLLFTNQTSPLFPGGKPGSLKGRASSCSVLFLVGWGNSGLRKAMMNGGITELRHTDYQIQNYLLVFQKYTTIVYGEGPASGLAEPLPQ